MPTESQQYNEDGEKQFIEGQIEELAEEYGYDIVGKICRVFFWSEIQRAIERHTATEDD